MHVFGIRNLIATERGANLKFPASHLKLLVTVLIFCHQLNQATSHHQQHATSEPSPANKSNWSSLFSRANDVGTAAVGVGVAAGTFFNVTRASGESHFCAQQHRCLKAHERHGRHLLINERSKRKKRNGGTAGRLFTLKSEHEDRLSKVGNVSERHEIKAPDLGANVHRESQRATALFRKQTHPSKDNNKGGGGGDGGDDDDDDDKSQKLEPKFQLYPGKPGNTTPAEFKSSLLVSAANSSSLSDYVESSVIQSLDEIEATNRSVYSLPGAGNDDVLIYLPGQDGDERDDYADESVVGLTPNERAVDETLASLKNRSDASTRAETLGANLHARPGASKAESASAAAGSGDEFRNLMRAYSSSGIGASARQAATTTTSESTAAVGSSKLARYVNNSLSARERTQAKILLNEKNERDSLLSPSLWKSGDDDEKSGPTTMNGAANLTPREKTTLQTTTTTTDRGAIETYTPNNAHYNQQSRLPPRARRYCIYVPAPIKLWHCQGAQMSSVPEDLNPKPLSLLLSSVGVETLARTHLEPYKTSLRDLRIQRTGLRRWPDLSKFVQERILTSVDLDNNKIETLGARAINIRAELVNLEFNQLKSIDEFTFNGSEIGALSLSGNRQLSFIHPNAFSNLKNLIKLDLSSTSVAQLPTIGLHQLRHLEIRDNFALRQIPSIYVFPMLEEAHLTYAYHCCSFRYPQTHDPNAYEEHVRMQNEINAICNAKTKQSERETGKVTLVAATLPGVNNFGVSSEISLNRSPSELTSPVLPGQSSATTTESSGFEGFFETGETRPGSEWPTDLEPIKQSASSSSSNNNNNNNHDKTQRNDNSAKATTSTNGGGGSLSFDISGTAGGHSTIAQLIHLQNIECGDLVPNASVQNITCTPEPDAFNPCEDIMGYPVLRVAVWFVVACSVFGNMSVIVVLLGIFKRLSVPKFLQLNLAVGDLVMGFYLAMLAAADLTTVGTYFNYAIDWQHGLGCRLAGASSLFASQLSIFTLIVITFERYYTITYSIDLNMRLQLGWAARIMLFGWIYAFAAAMLPAFGSINSYSMTSICLPMRTTYRLDRLFIYILLIVDSCAFLIIFICYLKMYLLVLKQKTEATQKERTVAMRMALLVFTDFACWAPIIFFGATAVYGRPLISVTNSKILIVFFYPLNSMANPFLYVLSTRQYRRDLDYVLSRWRHWRKSLFKSQEEKDFNSFNNYVAPYNGPMAKVNQPAQVNAQLSAIAAMTGVANHLHHYKLPANYMTNRHQQDQGASSGGGQHFELIKLPMETTERDNRAQCRVGHEKVSCEVSHHKYHHCRHRHRRDHCRHRCHHQQTRANNDCKRRHVNGDQRQTTGCEPIKEYTNECVATATMATTTTQHYIIRHKIMPGSAAGVVPFHSSQIANRDRLAAAAAATRDKNKNQLTAIAANSRTGCSLIGENKKHSTKSCDKSLKDSKTLDQIQNKNITISATVVKLGHLIDDNEQISSLLSDSQEALDGPDIASESSISKVALAGDSIVKRNTNLDNSIGSTRQLIGNDNDDNGRERLYQTREQNDSRYGTSFQLATTKKRIRSKAGANQLDIVIQGEKTTTSEQEFSRSQLNDDNNHKGVEHHYALARSSGRSDLDKTTIKNEKTYRVINHWPECLCKSEQELTHKSSLRDQLSHKTLIGANGSCKEKIREKNEQFGGDCATIKENGTKRLPLSSGLQINRYTCKRTGLLSSRLRRQFSPSQNNKVPVKAAAAATASTTSDPDPTSTATPTATATATTTTTTTTTTNTTTNSSELGPNSSLATTTSESLNENDKRNEIVQLARLDHLKNDRNCDCREHAHKNGRDKGKNRCHCHHCTRCKIVATKTGDLNSENDNSVKKEGRAGQVVQFESANTVELNGGNLESRKLEGNHLMVTRRHRCRHHHKHHHNHDHHRHHRHHHHRNRHHQQINDLQQPAT